MNTLFQPIQLGEVELKNRIVMAPLTRARAGKSRTPNALMAEYYAQRADAGLILTEATSILPQGVGYADTPGIWSREQVEGWKQITHSVHQKGGKIFLQLWHVGRISDPLFLDGQLPVAPSAIAADGHVSLIRPQKPFVVPRALETHEIKEIIAAYRQAAIHAKEAGFDGVEIHGANGYLPEQFLMSTTNHRTDEYGGSLENRARFLLEATDAAISVWGAGRVGVHLSPRMDAHHGGDENPRETFSYVARELKKRQIAFIFLRESQGEGYLTPILKKEFGGIVIANQGLSIESASALIEKGEADLVSFGQLYIANPDLATRLQKKAPLNTPDPSTFYGGGPKGYIDYAPLSGGSL